MFTLRSRDTWRILESSVTYRWVPRDAKYRSSEAWPGSGRFDDGATPTLYLSFTPEGATAEYLRRNPEFMDIQHDLKIDIFEVHISSESEGLDVSNESLAEAVGVKWERLRSSDPDEQIRYRECRQLAREVIDISGISIKYPSAALEETHNVVLFQTETSSWTADQGARIPAPQVNPELVTLLHVRVE